MYISLSQPYSFTQQGQRSNQEDSRYPDKDMPDVDQAFFLVCDGVGGCEAGEVASMSVCRGFAQALRQVDFSEPFTAGDFSSALSAAYDSLDHAAHEVGNSDMATTLTFVCFHAGGCTMAHIGDSRIYQLRPTEGIVYRSDDHSQLNSFVHSGLVSPDSTATDPSRSVISRYMGPQTDEEPRHMATIFETTDVQADDYFFLCSDGVLDRVDERKLMQIVFSKDTDEEKCRQIADMSRNSIDNNTAFLLHVAEVDRSDDDAEEADEAEEYVEHDTVQNRRPYALAEDVEAGQPEESLTDRIVNFFKNLIN